jgi:uncharacterized membrane protein (DUF4010 family)
MGYFVKGNSSGRLLSLRSGNLGISLVLCECVLIFVFSEAAYFLSSFIHPSMVYVVVAVSSVVSSTAAAASIVSLFTGGSISLGLAVNLFIFASAAGIIDKLVFVKLGGDNSLFKRLLLPFVMAFIVIAYFFIRIFFNLLGAYDALFEFIKVFALEWTASCFF